MKRLLLLSALFSLITIWANAQELPCYEAGLVDINHPCVPTVTVTGCDCVTYGSPCDAIYHNGITHMSEDASSLCGGFSPCHADFAYSLIGAEFFMVDSSQGASGNTMGYSYDFGDGSPISTNANPNYTYSTAGYYMVTMTIVDTGFCTATTYRVVLAQAPPCSPTFSDATVCGVTTLSDITVGTGYTVNWHFGDGDSSMNQPAGGTVSHSYPASGTYAITMFISDGGTGSCNGTLVDSIDVIIPSVSASFTYTTTGSPNNVVTFTNTSTGGTTYHWDFGDGDSSLVQSPAAHDYGSTCNYDVELIATDGNGCSNTTTQNIDACNVGVFSAPTLLNSISVYPNPAKEDVTVVMNSSKANDVVLTVKDVTGREVMEAISIHLHSGENNYKLALPLLAAGVYMIQISDESGMMNKSVLIR